MGRLGWGGLIEGRANLGNGLKGVGMVQRELVGPTPNRASLLAHSGHHSDGSLLCSSLWLFIYIDR